MQRVGLPSQPLLVLWPLSPQALRRAPTGARCEPLLLPPSPPYLGTSALPQHCLRSSNVPIATPGPSHLGGLLALFFTLSPSCLMGQGARQL